MTAVKTKDTVVALLDGDIISVKAAAIAGKDANAELEDVYWTVRSLVKEWREAAFADRAIVCLSEGRSFRYDVYADYKSNRVGKQKPRGTDEARQYLLDNYECRFVDTLEADDVMGILATEPDQQEVRVIVSTDKDMLTVPGWQVNPDKDRWPHKPTGEEALQSSLKQAMCGDSGDGYPGLPGFGPVAWDRLAAEHVGDPRQLIYQCELLYTEAGMSPDYWESMADCACILWWETATPEQRAAVTVPTDRRTLEGV